jgi:hypothetical protein
MARTDTQAQQKLQPEYKRMDVRDLNPFKDNPRRGRIDEIVESLRKHGQYRPVVVNLGTYTGRPNEVLAGNHTLLAAQQLGWDELDAGVIDVDENMARSIMLADNRLADLGTYDNDVLAAVLADMPDLAGTGYSAEDLEALMPKDDQAPDDFPEFGDDIATEHCCPKCGSEWSGKTS